MRKDIHARAMLDQLVAAGTVAAEGGTVRLLEDSYRPGQGSADQLAYLAANGQDFLSAAIDNVLGEGARHFERAFTTTICRRRRSPSLPRCSPTARPPCWWRSTPTPPGCSAPDRGRAGSGPEDISMTPKTARRGLVALVVAACLALAACGAPQPTPPPVDGGIGGTGAAER
ncbi:MAG: hypothetical protein JKP98_01105 [Rhodobacteraceae bacterium]|nr:hypothetical protein [Paracoccaceae bacterium]